MRKRLATVLAGATAVVLGVIGAGLGAPAPNAQPATAPTPEAAAPLTEVTGFRSAKFGMTEDEVRAAIAKEFKLKSKDVVSDENPVAQTPMLKAKVPDLLPKGGTAEVVYVFGYKTKKLIQVNVSWTKETDPDITPERISTNATLLQNYLRTAGYKPDTINTQPTAIPGGNGLMVFQGADAQGRTTTLIVLGSLVKGDKDQQNFVVSGLALTYVADTKNPDIFRLAPGQF